MEEEKGRRMKKIISKIEVLILLLFSVNSFSEQNYGQQQYGQQQYEQIIGFLTEINNTRNNSLNIIPLRINKNVDDLGFILYDLVNRQQFQKIDEILPDYMNDINHDKGMVDYISAERAYFNGDYPLALKFYLKIVNGNPNSVFAEMKLAHVYIKNSYHHEALTLYKKIKNKYRVGLPEERIKQIDSEITALENRANWQGNFNADIKYDTNYTEAHGNKERQCNSMWCMQGSEIKSGLVYGFSGNTNKVLWQYRGHSLLAGIGGHVWEYPHRSVKRRFSSYSSVSYQYLYGNKKVTFSPIVDMNWRGHLFDHYSVGASVTGAYSPSNKLYLLSNLTYKNQTFFGKRVSRSGYDINYSITAIYSVNPQWSLFSNLYGGKNIEKYKSDSYQFSGLTVGSINVFGTNKLVNKLTSSNHYFFDFDSALNTKRSDESWELNSQITLLGHTFLSLTPTLYVNYKFNDSSAKISYSYNKSEVGLNLSKTF
ncbi:surface lipoprotein assembly modifier [Providencia alcalifaciens]